MNLTYYFSALFVGAVLAVIVAVKRHKKETKIIESLNESIKILRNVNKVLDEMEATLTKDKQKESK